MKKSLFIVAVALIVCHDAQAVPILQGTPSVLRCSFSGGLDLHANYEPLSPVVTRVACGSTVLVIDTRFGSAHLRTEGGVDGFIHQLNLGQFRFDPVSVQPTSPQPLTPAQPIATPPVEPQVVPFAAPPNPQFAPESRFRRFEIGYLVFSYNRQGEINAAGGGLNFTTNFSERFGITGEITSHEDIDFEGARITTYRAGPRFYFPEAGRVKAFTELLVGGGRAEASVNVGGIDVGAAENFFAMAGGFGLDVRIRDWVGWRAVRADYSYLHSSGFGSSNGLRVGTGVVFRFGRS